MDYPYDTIIISPHLDDAALSCAGQIHLRTAAGKPVLVVTIMAGDAPQSGLSEYAQGLHQRWQLEHDAGASRRAEDIKAAQIMGADPIHLPFADCIYRRDSRTGEHYYCSDEAIFAQVKRGEEALIQEISVRLRALPHAKRILAPFGVGNHVDHQIARSAAEKAFSNRLFYYEEYPYAAEPGPKNGVNNQDRDKWEEIIIPLSPEALQVKMDAIAAYQSQLSTFFEDRKDLEKQVKEYVQVVRGERLWRPEFKSLDY